MANKTFPLVRGRVMRVTRLDACGRIQPGACSAIVTDGFVSVALTAQVDAGTAITVTNAAGKTCVSDPAVPSFNGYTMVVTFCQVDPMLYSIMSNQPVVVDSDGDVVGFRANSDVDIQGAGFALEVWSNVPSVACSGSGAQGTYGYTLFPFVSGGVLGDFTIDNNAVTFVLNNAATKTGSGWDVGPYDVVDNGAGVAGPLIDPIESGDHMHVQLTTVAPPEPSEDCIASGPRSLTGVAGTPGHFNPTDSYARESFADLTVSPTLVASPTTAWTTGQYILLGDGTKAHWTGTAWAAGPA